MVVKREEYLRIRLSESEKEDLLFIAEMNGLSMADILRELIQEEKARLGSEFEYDKLLINPIGSDEEFVVGISKVNGDKDGGEDYYTNKNNERILVDWKKTKYCRLKKEYDDKFSLYHIKDEKYILCANTDEKIIKIVDIDNEREAEKMYIILTKIK